MRQSGLQALHRQTVAPKHLADGDGSLALLGSLNAVGQRLPADQHVCGHRIKSSTQSRRRGRAQRRAWPSANARIAMGAHQSGTPTMASQQPVTIKALHRHHTIARLQQAVDEQGRCRGSTPSSGDRACPQQPGSKPSTSRATTHAWGRPVSSCAPGQWLIQLAMVITRPAN